VPGSCAHGKEILSSWFRASQFSIDKNQTSCNSTQSDLFYCKITLHVSDVHRTIIRSTKTASAASGTGHNIGTAVSQVGTWSSGMEVAVPI